MIISVCKYYFKCIFFLFFSETFRPLLLLSQVNETNETFRKTKRIKETYKMFHKKQKEKKKRRKKKLFPLGTYKDFSYYQLLQN